MRFGAGRASNGLSDPALWRKMTLYPRARNCLRRRVRGVQPRSASEDWQQRDRGPLDLLWACVSTHSAEMAPLVPALKLSMKRTHRRSRGTVVPLRRRI